MSDVLFVALSDEPTISNESVGTLLLATILKQKGISVDIYRYFEADLSKDFASFVDETVENIIRRKPAIVSFYCRCDYYLSNIKIAEKLKAKRPDIYIVFGGPQADASAEETIRLLPWVDFCCSGEGETTVYPLFSGLLQGTDVTGVDGLTYRTPEGNIVSNPRPALIKNLDEEPYLDFSFIPDYVIEKSLEINEPFPVDAGRGCPFNCSYCSSSIFWERKFRLKSTERIISEITRLNQRYNAKLFSIKHDLFTANKKKLTDFCNKLIESNLNINWRCSSRIDTLDAECVDLMVKSGLSGVFLGIETGSERMQKIIHKNLRVNDVLKVTKRLTENNVSIMASFIYGFPEETEEDLEQTLRVVHELYKMGEGVFFQFHLCTITQGTEYYNKYKDELVFAKQFSNIVGDFGVQENTEFINNHKELFTHYSEYHNEFRERFSNLDKIAKLCIKTYDFLLNLKVDGVADMKLTKLVLDFKKANEDLIDTITFGIKNYDLEHTAISNYFSAMYSGEQLQKLLQALSFHYDLLKMRDLSNKITSDVKLYSIDVKDFTNGLPLSEIRTRNSMVYFNKVGDKITYIVKYLG